jgi:hypothetical protein
LILLALASTFYALPIQPREQPHHQRNHRTSVIQLILTSQPRYWERMMLAAAPALVALILTVLYWLLTQKKTS